MGESRSCPPCGLISRTRDPNQPRMIQLWASPVVSDERDAANPGQLGIRIGTRTEQHNDPIYSALHQKPHRRRLTTTYDNYGLDQPLNAA